MHNESSQTQDRKFKAIFHPQGQHLKMLGVVGDRIIRGTATSEAISRNGQRLSTKGCTVRLPIPLLSEHGFTKARTTITNDLSKLQIGQIFEILKMADRIEIRAALFDTAAADAAWQLIQSGECRGLSCAAVSGSAQLAGVVDGISFFDSWILFVGILVGNFVTAFAIPFFV